MTAELAKIAKSLTPRMRDALVFWGDTNLHGDIVRANMGNGGGTHGAIFNRGLIGYGHDGRGYRGYFLNALGWAVYTHLTGKARPADAGRLTLAEALVEAYGADAPAPAAEVTPADVVRYDGVTVRADGRMKYTVTRGQHVLGVIWDEGPEMSRGRYATWSPYAPTAGFFTDAAAAVDSIVDAWPPTLGGLAVETGLPLADVVAAADALAAEWEGTEARVYRTAIRGAGAKVTFSALALIRAELGAPAGRYAVPVARDEQEWPRFNGYDRAVRFAISYGLTAAAVIDSAPAATPGEEPAPAAAPAEEEPAASPAPAPEWRTLKGMDAPFLMYGEETEDGSFYPAKDRKQCTGEPVMIVRAWMLGGTRRGETAGGRTIHLWGVATRYWVAPAPDADVQRTAAERR